MNSEREKVKIEFDYNISIEDYETIQGCTSSMHINITLGSHSHVLTGGFFIVSCGRSDTVNGTVHEYHHPNPAIVEILSPGIN